MTPPFFGYAFLLIFLLIQAIQSSSSKDHESSAFWILYLTISGAVVLGFFVFDRAKFYWPPSISSTLISLGVDGIIFLTFYSVFFWSQRRDIGFGPLEWLFVSVFYCAILQLARRIIRINS